MNVTIMVDDILIVRKKGASKIKMKEESKGCREWMCEARFLLFK